MCTTELRQLEAFVAVATELHFGRTAEKLHLGQPTLSELVRSLERELGPLAGCPHNNAEQRDLVARAAPSRVTRAAPTSMSRDVPPRIRSAEAHLTRRIRGTEGADEPQSASD